MSIIDQAAQVIAKQMSPALPAAEELGEKLAQALYNAGLLASELPEPEEGPSRRHRSKGHTMTPDQAKATLALGPTDAEKMHALETVAGMTYEYSICINFPDHPRFLARHGTTTQDPKSAWWYDELEPVQLIMSQLSEMCPVHIIRRLVSTPEEIK